ncbi:hypothetical protein [Consotaella aegiceratis]|uniref:hypothetical protein n=1 Tax=Consotaella aegiceratis TaxID=3097961 RepID=UPI002F42AEC4
MANKETGERPGGAVAPQMAIDPLNIDRPLTEEHVRAAVAEPGVAPADRRARLEAMARVAAEQREPHIEDSELSLLELQIREALALVAEGGHAYDNADPFALEGDPSKDDLGS